MRLFVAVYERNCITVLRIQTGFVKDVSLPRCRRGKRILANLPVLPPSTARVAASAATAAIDLRGRIEVTRRLVDSTDLLKPSGPCRLTVRSLRGGSRRWFGLNSQGGAE